VIGIVNDNYAGVHKTRIEEQPARRTLKRFQFRPADRLLGRSINYLIGGYQIGQVTSQLLFRYNLNGCAISRPLLVLDERPGVVRLGRSSIYPKPIETELHQMFPFDQFSTFVRKSCQYSVKTE
jgi:hypothetical protein